MRQQTMGRVAWLLVGAALLFIASCQREYTLATANKLMMNDPLGFAMIDEARQASPLVYATIVNSVGRAPYELIAAIDRNDSWPVREALVSGLAGRAEAAVTAIGEAIEDARLSESTRDVLGNCLCRIGTDSARRVAADYYGRRLLDADYTVWWAPEHPEPLTPITAFRPNMLFRIRRQNRDGGETSVVIRSRAAYHVLVTLGDAAIPVLLDRLSATDVDVRVNAMMALKKVLVIGIGESVPYRPLDALDRGEEMKRYVSARRRGQRLPVGQKDGELPGTPLDFGRFGNSGDNTQSREGVERDPGSDEPGGE